MIRASETLRFGAGENGVALLGRSWSTEPGWAWSTERFGELRLPVPEGAGDAVIELELGPCVVPPAVSAQRLRIVAEGECLYDEEIGGNTTVRFTAPAGLSRRRELVLVLHHPDAVRPADLGAGEDTRRLGFRLFRAVALRLPPAQPRPQAPNRLRLDLEFGWGGSGLPCLGEGWSAPERDYVWALGQRSTLRIAAPEDGGPFLLVLDVSPCCRMPNLPCQRVLVGANGRLLSTLAFDRRLPLAFPLPPADPAPGGWEISFDNIDGAIPRETLRYHDGRNFVFMLLGLRLIETGPAEPRPQAGTDAPPAPETLVTGFEGLGHTCDFAALQGELGATRLGLLHVAGITTDGLLRGLAEGFRLLGRPDRLQVASREDDPRGWFSDSAYALTGPSGVRLGPNADPAIIRQAARTLPFLARRFLEQIQHGETTFLLRRPGNLLREEAEAILAGLRLHGPARLLWLVQDGTVPPGEVRRLGPHLLQGGLDGEGGGASAACWLSVLGGAWQMARY